MADVFASGFLHFLLVLGASYSIPIEKDPGYQAGESDSNAGSNVFAPSGYDSWASSAGAPRGLTYSPPSVRGPVTYLGSNAGGEPRYSGYPVYSGGGTTQTTRPVTSQDIEWLKAPPSPLVDVGDSQGDTGVIEGTGAGALVAGSSFPHGHSPHLHDVGPSTLYQGGELAHMHNTFEHGNFDTETETQGILSHLEDGPGGSLPVSVIMDSAGGLSVLNPDNHNVYPYFDYMFLTGQYPPGTVSHFSSSFEQGKDFWHDAHYDKYYPSPEDVNKQQVKGSPIVKKQAESA